MLISILGIYAIYLVASINGIIQEIPDIYNHTEEQTARDKNLLVIDNKSEHDQDPTSLYNRAFLKIKSSYTLRKEESKGKETKYGKEAVPRKTSGKLGKDIIELKLLDPYLVSNKSKIPDTKQTEIIGDKMEVETKLKSEDLDFESNKSEITDSKQTEIFVDDIKVSSERLNEPHNAKKNKNV
ncbi:hypothetical protein GJ496_004142 [Pomphorhynchus laevis]|nr:hypothetical protein GJ496_004142 [Pomphorhynchus laevis]